MVFRCSQNTDILHTLVTMDYNCLLQTTVWYTYKLFCVYRVHDCQETRDHWWQSTTNCFWKRLSNIHAHVYQGIPTDTVSLISPMGPTVEKALTAQGLDLALSSRDLQSNDKLWTSKGHAIGAHAMETMQTLLASRKHIGKWSVNEKTGFFFQNVNVKDKCKRESGHIQSNVHA